MARHITNPCLTCSKSVTNFQRAMCCEICKKWQHLKCSTLDLHDYIRILNCTDDWYCTNCIIITLPFINIDDDLEFINCLFNLARGFSASADVIKNSAQFKITNKFSLNDKNIDPDKNCIGELMGNGDTYYLEDDFTN